MILKDKVAIVTGSSRGIGLAIARQLAAQGASVAICSTSLEKSQSVATDIASHYGVKTLGVAVDVSQLASVDQMVSDVLAAFGRIDILVNNAGITKDQLVLRLSADDWQRVLDVNLNSVFFATKAVLRPMMKQKFGRLIHISSVVGVMGNPGQSNYAAAKAGMIGFSKSVASEMGSKGITSNVVAPGFIETDMIDALPEEYLNNIIGQVPVKRLGQPDDVAHAVVFLASDQSSYITGKVFEIDGGLHM